MFGADVVSDWREGSPIVWKGEWKGKPYEDKGVILRVQPNEKLEYTHYSPLTGAPDVPDSYHTVTVTLTGEGAQTRVIDRAGQQRGRRGAQALGGKLERRCSAA